MATQNPPDPPWLYLFMGVLTSLVGAVGLLVVGFDNGPATLGALVFVWFGSVLAMIGVVGIGVTIGMRRADWHIRRKG